MCTTDALKTNYENPKCTQFFQFSQFFSRFFKIYLILIQNKYFFCSIMVDFLIPGTIDITFNFNNLLVAMITHAKQQN